MKNNEIQYLYAQYTKNFIKSLNLAQCYAKYIILIQCIFYILCTFSLSNYVLKLIIHLYTNTMQLKFTFLKTSWLPSVFIKDKYKYIV